jgi:hypothetical protein
MTKVLLTVDTELLGRHHAAGASWQENLERSYDAAGVGVPYQLKMLGAHGLKACFFVDPMPALVYGLDPVKRMVEPILEAGQEVQLHLHPLWATIDEPAEDRKFELTDFGREGQRDLIARRTSFWCRRGRRSRSPSGPEAMPSIRTRCGRWRISAFASTAAITAPTIPGRAHCRSTRG